MQQWIEAGVTDLGLPELDPLEYMVWFMLDIKPTRNNGMSDGPTDWDILFPYATAKALDDEDTAILSDMCKAYYNALREGENPLCIAPVDRG